jgi:hypothetical protein
VSVRRARAAVRTPPKRCPRAARAVSRNAPVLNAASRARYANQSLGRSRAMFMARGVRKGRISSAPKCQAAQPAQAPEGTCAATARRPRPKRHRTGEPVRPPNVAEAPWGSCHHRGARSSILASQEIGAGEREVELWAAAEAAFRGAPASGNSKLGCVGRNTDKLRRAVTVAGDCALRIFQWAYIPHHRGVSSATLCFPRKRGQLNISTRAHRLLGATDRGTPPVMRFAQQAARAASSRERNASR